MNVNKYAVLHLKRCPNKSKENKIRPFVYYVLSPTYFSSTFPNNCTVKCLETQKSFFSHYIYQQTQHALFLLVSINQSTINIIKNVSICSFPLIIMINGWGKDLKKIKIKIKFLTFYLSKLHIFLENSLGTKSEYYA